MCSNVWFSCSPWEKLLETVLRLERTILRRNPATGLWTSLGMPSYRRACAALGLRVPLPAHRCMIDIGVSNISV